MAVRDNPGGHFFGLGPGLRHLFGLVALVGVGFGL